MADEDLASLVKILVGLKIYLVWYDDPYYSEVGNDGEEFGVTHKTLEGIFASRKKAEEYIEMLHTKWLRTPKDYEIEEEVIQ